ncbi:hypothetical protein M5W70_15410 [Paenibacillus larvae]|nr:hypothetical protein [Paenibacillus larvae]MCY9690041.1 hypothetical protein [Paenibacillus larvae]MDT2253526.1 hypothetical protein [Paenibacillus larvae]
MTYIHNAIMSMKSIQLGDVYDKDGQRLRPLNKPVPSVNVEPSGLAFGLINLGGTASKSALVPKR